MGKIVLLDDSTINKIAAGEVIERPASVVKEIIENSIDAGATNITVEIKNGGISYIRVTDNGKGIMQDDMEIAFERHATSKLRSAEDLNDIKSMGFRGEALASIAAIARVELISKTKESTNGYKVVIQGGIVEASCETGAPDGTTITVENLFYNTPVRYKFLKKDFTESGYIEDVVTRIALVHPEISIKLINTGKTIIQTSGNGDLKAVIYNIYGKDIAENLIDIDYEYENMKITGVIGKPVISRSNRTNQLFFVNKRYVRDKALSGAAEQAFKGFITIGKHGFLVLNIEMNPKMVDVNVHPAKLEVRFQEENLVFKAVYHAIKDGLSREDLIASTSSIDGIDKNKVEEQEKVYTYEPKENTTVFRNLVNKQEELTREQKEENDSKEFDEITSKLQKMQEMVNMVTNINKEIEPVKMQENQNIENEQIKYIENQNEEKNQLSYEKNTNVMEEPKEESKTVESKITENTEDNQDNYIIQEEEPELNSSNFLEMYNKMFGTTLKKQEIKDENDVSNEFTPINQDDNLSIFEEKEKYNLKPAYKFIGIAFKTYIILEIKDELYILDQHAAHERIMYEKIKENYYNEEEKDSQLLLLPDIINLTHKEMGIYKDNIEMFEKAGFMVEEFGENTVKLMGVPNILLELETKELFLEALDEINTVARTAKQEIEERFIATVACKAAVKAHMALEKEEVENLLDQLLVLPNPFTCPHGRPTAIKMTKSDIEKKFSRIQ